MSYLPGLRLRPILRRAIPVACLGLLLSCTSLRIEPSSPYEGVVIGHAWSIHFLTISVPRAPRARALDLVGNATLSDVRNAEVETWPDFIWPFSWINAIFGWSGAEVRADYGLPPPMIESASPPVDPEVSTNKISWLDEAGR